MIGKKFPQSPRGWRLFRAATAEHLLQQKVRTDRKRQGFTILELAVALAILGALIVIGWGSMRSQLPRFRAVRAARSLRADMMYLRALSVQSNRQTRVRFLDVDRACAAGGLPRWEMSIGDQSSASTQWELLPPEPELGAEDRDRSQGERQVAVVGGRNTCLRRLSDADTIVFNPRGWIDNAPGDFSEGGYMEFAFADREGGDLIALLVARSGVVRLVQPQSAAP